MELSGGGEISDYYKTLVRKRLVIFFSIVVFALILVLLDLTLGSYDMSLYKFFDLVIKGELSDVDKLVMLNMRMPRSMTCVVVGLSLGVSGYYLQTILRNPIASPFTLGISSAATFGASFSIVTNFPFIFMGWNIQISAVLFSIICTMMMVVTFQRKKIGPGTMILFGVALNFFFVALQSLVQYIADEKEVRQMVNWLYGSVAKASWTGVMITAGTFIVIFFITYRRAWDLNVIGLSDDRARSMGLNTDRFRIFIFVASSIVTAVAISYVGTIGFVGLLAPHLARFFVGNDARYTASASALFGALLLLLASVLSKLILPGTILPIGIIMNIVGVPFMTVIAVKGKNNNVRG